MASIGRFYLRMLRERTLPTQMLTSSVICMAGDGLAQHVVERKSWRDHDSHRSARFAFHGAFVWAPVANRWHAFLNLINFSTPFRTVAARLAIDLPIFAPFALTLFFTSMGLMEGKSFSQIRENLEKNFVKGITTSVSIFGPVQAINQLYMPLYARPPFINLAALGFQTFLATLYHKPKPLGVVETAEKVALAAE